MKGPGVKVKCLLSSKRCNAQNFRQTKLAITLEWTHPEPAQCVCVFVCVCLCLCVCVYVCLCVCACV